MSDSQDPPKKEILNSYMRYAGIGFQIGGIIAAGALIGWWSDRHFQNTKPYFTAFFALLFVFVAMYLAFKDFLKPPAKRK